MTVAFIADIWTTKSNRDFLGLAAVFTNNNFEREVLTIGMIRMAGNNKFWLKILVQEKTEISQYDSIVLRATFVRISNWPLKQLLIRLSLRKVKFIIKYESLLKGIIN